VVPSIIGVINGSLCSVVSADARVSFFSLHPVEMRGEELALASSIPAFSWSDSLSKVSGIAVSVLPVHAVAGA
jgi:hypothetical protein